MNWNNYDNWKLATPYDNEPDYEIFKAEKYDFFTMDYDAVIEFDTKVLAASQFRSDEDLEEFAEELAEELGLLDSEEAVVIEYEENERSEREYALECRYEAIREARLLREED